MIIYEGEKYACFPCVRGHRSSSCHHKDRPLLLVRKRGRPISSDAARLAIVPDASCLEGGPPTACACGCQKDGSMECQCASHDHSQTGKEAIRLAPGYHQKQYVDTRDGVVRVVDPRTLPEPPAGCNSPRVNKIKPRLRLKRSAMGNSPSRLPELWKVESEALDGLPDGRLEVPRDVSFEAPGRPEFPDRASETSGSETTEPAPNVEYVFVPVGDGLYRKEPRLETPIKNEEVDVERVNIEPDNGPVNFEAHYSHVQEHRHTTEPGPAYSHPAYTPAYISPNMSHSLSIASTSSSSASSVDSLIASSTSSDQYTHPVEAAPVASEPKKSCCASQSGKAASPAKANPKGKHTPPMIIAPMNFDGSLLEDLDLSFMDDFSLSGPIPAYGTDPLGTKWSADEAHASPARGGSERQEMKEAEDDTLERLVQSVSSTVESASDFYDVYYAASCVIPGQCQCGDGCSCAGCPTHDAGARKEPNVRGNGPNALL